MRRLSVTIIAWNEEARLRDCLESVSWADEIIVIDAESTDKTAQLAREFTDKVWVRPWPGFPVQKNFALEQATGDWVLSLDADERVSPELRERVRRILTGARGYDTAGSIRTISSASSGTERAASWRARFTSQWPCRVTSRRSPSLCSITRIAGSRTSWPARTAIPRWLLSS